MNPGCVWRVRGSSGIILSAFGAVLEGLVGRRARGLAGSLGKSLGVGWGRECLGHAIWLMSRVVGFTSGARWQRPREAAPPGNGHKHRACLSQGCLRRQSIAAGAPIQLRRLQLCRYPLQIRAPPSMLKVSRPPGRMIKVIFKF